MISAEQTLRPTVRLDVFDGPLDLLLYLVHSHELDPRTIPVSQIADQYIAFLDSAQENDLAVAGEYLVMAAKLLSLKARELLPREQQGELEPEEFDGFDREELVKQLLEYRRFKQAAEGLRGLEARVWGAYPRGMTDAQGDKPKTEDDDGLEAGLMGLFDLLKAFRSVLSVRPRNIVHEIEIDDIPLEERMNRIRAHLVREGKALFDELYPHDGRKLLPVVTFMAIMELTKNEELAFRQAGTFQPMTVYRKADDRYADELAHMDQIYSPDPVLNPDVLGLLAEKERLRIEALAREEATWGGNGIDPETGELLPGFADDLVEGKAATEGHSSADVQAPVEGQTPADGQSSVEVQSLVEGQSQEEVQTSAEGEVASTLETIAMGSLEPLEAFLDMETGSAPALETSENVSSEEDAQPSSENEPLESPDWGLEPAAVEADLAGLPEAPAEVDLGVVPAVSGTSWLEQALASARAALGEAPAVSPDALDVPDSGEPPTGRSEA